MSSIKGLKSKIFLKELTPAFFLLLNTFVWYLLIYFTLTNIFTQSAFKSQSLDLFTFYFIAMATAAIAGSKVPVRARDTLLNVWLLLGALATFLLVIISSDNPVVNGLVITFLGVSVGIGLPSCLSYFAKAASIEKRGLIGGAIWSTVGLCVLALGFLANILGAIALIVLLGAWRLIGSFSFIFLNQKSEKTEPQKSPSYMSIIRKKETLLFLLPWIMFTVINFAEKPMLQQFFGVAQYSLVESAEFVFIGIFAFIGGLIADIGGRKRVIIAGFVMLGFEYAALSVFSGSANPVLISYVFMTLDGATWGLLFSVFFTAIWGDLGENYEKEKFYVLGGIPLLLTNLLSVVIEPYAASVPLGTAFTIASFFLFAAVIPLMYAPETLPDKAIKDRDLKSYVEKALKKAQSEEQKREASKESTEEDVELLVDKKEDEEEYEKAKQLAEKYY